MSEPFVGEIKIVGFSFAPNGWAKCDGQLLAVSQNDTLFSLFGTQYGGDGRTTFGLPELRGRFPMHVGTGPGLTPRTIGQKFGSENTTLTTSQLPAHNHTGRVVSATTEGDRTSPTAAFPARPEEPVQPYAGASGATMANGSIQVDNAGSGNSFSHLPPYQVLNFVVALTGIYPSRS